MSTRSSRAFLYFVVSILCFAIGYFFPRGEQTQPEVEPSFSVSRNKELSAQEYWRSVFVEILKEPSASLRMVSYYAYALEIPLDEMGDAFDAIYPEGWVRFRGDLPLAISMEWLRKGGNGMGRKFQMMDRMYPELRDNLDGVFANFGFQGELEAIPILQSLQDGEFKDAMIDTYLRGLDDISDEMRFRGEIALLPPSKVFSNINEAKMDIALAAFWDNAARYLEEGAYPSELFWLRLGERYGSQVLDRIPKDRWSAAMLVGALMQPDAGVDMVVEQIELFDTLHFNQSYLFSEDDAIAITEALANRPELRRFLIQSSFAGILRKGLQPELATALLRSGQIGSREKMSILGIAGHAVNIDLAIEELMALSAYGREQALSEMVVKMDADDMSIWLSSLPEEWLTKGVLSRGLHVALTAGDSNLVQSFAEIPGGLTSLLPTQNMRRVLWEVAPELYLEAAIELPEESRVEHLKSIAGVASEEDTDLLLEMVDQRDRNAVLADIAYIKTEYVWDRIRRDGSFSMDVDASGRLGSAIARNIEVNDAMQFFLKRDVDSAAVRAMFVSYYRSAAYSDEVAAEIRSSIGKSDSLRYVVESIDALKDPSSSWDEIRRLKTQNSETFMELLLGANGAYSEAMRNASQFLESSGVFSPEEKDAIHVKMYRSGTR